MTLLAVASFFLLIFLSQQAHASGRSKDAASSQASASADASGSGGGKGSEAKAAGDQGDAKREKAEFHAEKKAEKAHHFKGRKSDFAAAAWRFTPTVGAFDPGSPSDPTPPPASDPAPAQDPTPGSSPDSAPTTGYDLPPAPDPSGDQATSPDAPPTVGSDPVPEPTPESAPVPDPPPPPADDGESIHSPGGGSDKGDGGATTDQGTSPVGKTFGDPASGATPTGTATPGSDSGTTAGPGDAAATPPTTPAAGAGTDQPATAPATTPNTSAATVAGPIGPTNIAPPPACPAQGSGQTPGATGLGLLIAAPLPGTFGMLGHGLMATALPGSRLRVDLGDVIEHVRNLARQATTLPGKAPNGNDQPPLPTPVPAAPPAPPAPAEQSNGSSISIGSHNHHKGGSSYAVLGAALGVLYLRPLVLARLASASGFSRSFRPLALPG